MRAGLLHIYHGGGKGKTTAAAGLCLRAAGHGLRVGFAQFLKDGSSGECAALKVLPGVTVFDALPHVPFTFSMTPEEREEARDFYASLLRACESAASGLDLLVLDEVLDAVNTGILPEESLRKEPARQPGAGPHRPGSLSRAPGAGRLHHRNAGCPPPLPARSGRPSRHRMVTF